MTYDSIKFLVQSIEKSSLIERNNIFYQKFSNFFDNNLVNHIEGNIDFVKKENLKNQHDKPRQKSLDSDKLVKEMKIIFSHRAIRDSLESKYQQNFKLASIDFWYDTAEYFLPPHIDNDSIRLSLQIYLGKDQQPGTVLFDSLDAKNYFDIFPFSFNGGYSMLHNGHSFHGLEYPVEKSIRKSLYIRFT